MSEIDNKSLDINVNYHELVDIFNGANSLVLKPNKHINNENEHKQEYLTSKENDVLPVLGEPLQIPLNIHGQNYANDKYENIQFKEHENEEISSHLRLDDNTKKKDILNDIFDELKEDRKMNHENSHSDPILKINNNSIINLNKKSDIKTSLDKHIPKITMQTKNIKDKIQNTDSKNKFPVISNEAQKLIQKSIKIIMPDKSNNLNNKQTNKEISKSNQIKDLTINSEINANTRNPMQLKISKNILKTESKQVPTKVPTFLTVTPTTSEDEFDI